MRRRRFPAVVVRQVGLPIIILALAVSFFLVHRDFGTLSNFQNMMRQASILAIVSFGQFFPVLSGGMDISVGATVAASSVLSGLASKEMGIYLAFVAGALFGLVVGTVNGMVSARFRVHPLIVTLGTLTALRGFALSISGGVPISNLPESYTWLGRGFLGPVAIPVVIGVVLFAISYVTQSYTRFGRYTYAIGGNEEAATISGINIFKYKTLNYALCGAMAGIGGAVLSSRVGSGEPNLGVELNLESITAVLVGGVAFGGGRGSVVDVLFGVGLLSVLSNGLNFSGVRYFTQQMIIGAILIFSIILDRYRHE